jgi:hypothetical protein
VKAVGLYEQGKPMVQTAGTYRIAIQGVLDEGWSDRLGGLKIRPARSRDGQAITILSGEMVDQTALLGVLNTLYDLHLPIFFVESLPAPGPVPGSIG